MYKVSYSGTNATISVTANGANLSNNSYVDENTTISVTATPSTNQYTLTGITATGATDNGNGTYTIINETIIKVSVVEKSEDVKKQEILAELQNNTSKYLTNMTISADGSTITSTSTTSTVTFKADFLALLKSYGYSSISYDIKVSNTSAQIVEGSNADLLATKISGTQNLSTDESDQSYTAQTVQYMFFASKAKVDWTLSNVTFNK